MPAFPASLWLGNLRVQQVGEVAGKASLAGTLPLP